VARPIASSISSLSRHRNLADANGIPLLSALVLLAGERKSNASFALVDLADEG
jgi:hypothetical protein